MRHPFHAPRFLSSTRSLERSGVVRRVHLLPLLPCSSPQILDEVSERPGFRPQGRHARRPTSPGTPGGLPSRAARQRASPRECLLSLAGFPGIGVRRKISSHRAARSNAAGTRCEKRVKAEGGNDQGADAPPRTRGRRGMPMAVLRIRRQQISGGRPPVMSQLRLCTSGSPTRHTHLLCGSLPQHAWDNARRVRGELRCPPLDELGATPPPPVALRANMSETLPPSESTMDRLLPLRDPGRLRTITAPWLIWSAASARRARRYGATRLPGGYSMGRSHPPPPRMGRSQSWLMQAEP